MEIIFKDLKGYEDYYSISTNGIIKSKRYNKYLKHDISKYNKIHSVRLVDENGVVKKHSVIRLMALTFLDNPNPKLYNNAINKNGNHNDLSIDNVMWGTPFIQVDRKYNRFPELKKSFISKSVKINTRKMTDKLVNDLYKMRDLGYSINQLSDIFPIKKSQIFNLLKVREKKVL